MLSFILCLKCFRIFTSLVQFHIFTFTLSLLVHVLLQTQTTPKIGRDIIPDILDPVLQPDPTFSISYTLLILSINNV